jgi:type IV pilus assembly protein PilV
MRSRSRGFTLVESLIALLLLSVGLLGAGVLLLDGLRAHSDATRLVSATRLVREMADRIRANPRARDLYDTRGAAMAGDCDAGQPCEPAQRAASDLAWFSATARGLFPGVETPESIQFEPAIGTAAPDHFTLSLRWHGPREAAGVEDAVTLHLLAQPVAG